MATDLEASINAVRRQARLLGALFPFGEELLLHFLDATEEVIGRLGLI